jgi:hypothetical protein
VNLPDLSNLPRPDLSRFLERGNSVAVKNPVDRGVIVRRVLLIAEVVVALVLIVALVRMLM